MDAGRWVQLPVATFYLMGACAVFTFISVVLRRDLRGQGLLALPFTPPGTSAPVDTDTTTKAVVLLLAALWSSPYADHLPPFRPQSAPSMPLGLVTKIYCKSSGLKQQEHILLRFLRPGI